MDKDIKEVSFLFEDGTRQVMNWEQYQASLYRAIQTGMSKARR